MLAEFRIELSFPCRNLKKTNFQRTLNPVHGATQNLEYHLHIIFRLNAAERERKLRG